MSTIWDKFDKVVDTSNLKKEAQEAKDNGYGERREIPDDSYEVSVDKLELKASQAGKPMVSAWLKIVAGEFENNFMFYNQVIDQGFGLHNANEFLRAMDCGDVEFDSFGQYGKIIEDIKKDCDKCGLTFQVKQKTNGNFKNLTIEDVFEPNAED